MTSLHPLHFREMTFPLVIYAGPSAPRSVSLRAGYNSEVCATWRLPATISGTIILYNLYAEVVKTSAVDAVDLPSDTVVKVRHWTHTHRV